MVIDGPHMWPKACLKMRSHPQPTISSEKMMIDMIDHWIFMDFGGTMGYHTPRKNNNMPATRPLPSMAQLVRAAATKRRQLDVPQEAGRAVAPSTMFPASALANLGMKQFFRGKHGHCPSKEQ